MEVGAVKEKSCICSMCSLSFTHQVTTFQQGALRLCNSTNISIKRFRILMIPQRSMTKSSPAIIYSLISHDWNSLNVLIKSGRLASNFLNSTHWDVVNLVLHVRLVSLNTSPSSDVSFHNIKDHICCTFEIPLISRMIG